MMFFLFVALTSHAPERSFMSPADQPTRRRRSADSSTLGNVLGGRRFIVPVFSAG